MCALTRKGMAVRFGVIDAGNLSRGKVSRTAMTAITNFPGEELTDPIIDNNGKLEKIFRGFASLA